MSFEEVVSFIRSADPNIFRKLVCVMQMTRDENAAKEFAVGNRVLYHTPQREEESLEGRISAIRRGRVVLECLDGQVTVSASLLVRRS